MPLPRRAAASAVLALAALAAAGCTATNAQSTQTLKNPGDGTDVDLGPVHVASLLVVSDAQGLGTLVVRLVNSSLQPVQVSIADTGSSGFSRTFTVPGSSTLAVGPQEDQRVSISSVGAPPGSIVDYSVGVGSDRTTVPVPVLDGTLSEYKTLVPTATATSSSPTASSAATPSSASTSTRSSSTPSRAGGTATQTPGTVTQAPTTTSTRQPSPSLATTTTG